jgi:hypothetical protein
MDLIQQMSSLKVIEIHLGYCVWLGVFKGNGREGEGIFLIIRVWFNFKEEGGEEGSKFPRRATF